jgi:hypothetical protein
VNRFREAVKSGELPADTDVDSLGDFYAAVLHGISIQAGDGVSRAHPVAIVPRLLTLLRA